MIKNWTVAKAWEPGKGEPGLFYHECDQVHNMYDVSCYPSLNPRLLSSFSVASCTKTESTLCGFRAREETENEAMVSLCVLCAV